MLHFINIRLLALVGKLIVARLLFGIVYLFSTIGARLKCLQYRHFQKDARDAYDVANKYTDKLRVRVKFTLADKHDTSDEVEKHGATLIERHNIQLTVHAHGNVQVVEVDEHAKESVNSQDVEQWIRKSIAQMINVLHELLDELAMRQEDGDETAGEE